LSNLVGGAQAQTAGAWRSLSGISLVIALLVLLFLLPVKLPYNTSVQDALQWDGLWRDPLQKQITGFGLLGSGLLLALLGLRKRLSVFRWGSFERWRLLHVILGLTTTAILLLHTGLRLGQELNLLLMLSFIGLLLSGSAHGCLYGFEHRLPAGWLSRTRRLSHWGHVLLLWPLPLLLGLHVAKTYYF
jgi:nitrite reductase (NADH) large subunit